MTQLRNVSFAIALALLAGTVHAGTLVVHAGRVLDVDHG